MRKYWIFIVLFWIGFSVSAIQPHDYFTWILEVFPTLLALVVLTYTFNKFRFSTLTYVFLLIHCFILFVGGHYTYAEVPLFDWIKELFHQSRNNYDKVGHFAQGFVPAMVIREIFVRFDVIKLKSWIPVLTVCVCLSISACYEFFEWFVAVVSGQSAEAFLGTQGDIWDTQSDMLFATIGAICMVIFVAKLQDKMIALEFKN